MTRQSKTDEVINLSSITLSKDQAHILSLGPKFCPTPLSFDKLKLKEDVAEGCRRLRLKEWFLDSEDEEDDEPPPPPPRFYKKTYYSPPSGRDSSLDAYCDTIQTLASNYVSSKKVRDNLSAPERKALHELKNMVHERKIRITRADKGGAVVVQDVGKYITEGQRLLSNPEHYETVKKDPTPQITTATNKIVDQLEKNHLIDETTHRWARLDPSNVRPHVFYHIPKVHKSLVDPPGRPIVSGVNGPTETLSKLVDHWLRPYVGCLPSFVRDSTDILRVVQDWNTNLGPFSDNVMLVTIDVVNLYGSIPHQDIANAVHHYMQSRPDDAVPPVGTVLDIVQHVLSNNFFTFEGQTYRQKSGTAMGTPMAPTIANLFMGCLEKSLLEESPVPIDEELWRRYIDDILVLWVGTEEELDTFSTFMNSFHPSIEFTVNSSKQEIAYLDILLKMESGYITTQLYTKETDTHSYLPFRSCHPRHCINNIPVGQFLRVRRLCSAPEDFERHSAKVTEYFRNRGYPDKLIMAAKEKAKATPRQTTLQYNQRKSDTRVPVVITHNPHNPPISKWLRDSLPTLHHSTRMAKAVPEAPVVGERKCKSLANLLMPSELPSVQTVPGNAGCIHCTKRCATCRDHLIEGNQFVSFTTGERFTIRKPFTCTSKNVIYLLSCDICGLQYVGETKNALKTRFYLHRSDIMKNTGTRVTQHFNQPGHSLHNVKCQVIEEVYGLTHDARLRRERFWRQKLRTDTPEGLNTRDG